MAMEEVHMQMNAPLTRDWSLSHSSIQPVFIKAN